MVDYLILVRQKGYLGICFKRRNKYIDTLTYFGIFSSFRILNNYRVYAYKLENV